jgi:hypothetical protein
VGTVALRARHEGNTVVMSRRRQRQPPSRPHPRAAPSMVGVRPAARAHEIRS